MNAAHGSRPILVAPLPAIPDPRFGRDTAVATTSRAAAPIANSVGSGAKQGDETRAEIRALPGWISGRHYLESVRQGERDITLDELEVVPGMMPFRVVLRTGGGRLRGTVENGNGGLVVLVPQEEQLRFRPFIVVAFFEGGTFALDNTRPGTYFAFALRGSFNADEMRNPAYARAYLDGAATVRLERDSTATMILHYVKVPSPQ